MTFEPLMDNTFPQTFFCSQSIFEVICQDNMVCDYVLCRIQLGADVLKKI